MDGNEILWLARGASPYDVAKLLSEMIETVEKHYAEFVREPRERVRRMMESNSARATGTCRIKATTWLKLERPSHCLAAQGPSVILDL